MTAWAIKNFIGEQPRISPNLLAPNASQFASNVRLDDGALTPYNEEFEVSSLADSSNFQTIFRWLGNWMGWAGVVSAAPGPVATNRLYLMGSGAPQMLADGTTYNLAVPFPSGALTATLVGSGSGDIITRTYVYTYVTGYSEESEPCPASNLVDWQDGQTVTLTGFAAPPAGRDITTIRIYRTQTGDSGTDLYYIDEMPATNSTYTDSIPDDQFAEVLPSRTYNAPPSTLTGLISMPNGMMAAFDSANPTNLYFCEPWLPHAWPEQYVLTTDYPIVGLASIATSLIILTTGYPYLAVGTDPSSMQMVKMATNLPCVNARSIVNLGGVVAYASTEGLVLAGPDGSAAIATQKLFNRQEWQTFAPTSLACSQLSGRYFASYNTTDADGNPFIGTLIIDVSEGAPFLVRSDVAAQAFFYDLTAGALYYLSSDGSISQFDSPSGAPMDYTWRSKLMILLRPQNFSCFLIDSDDSVSEAEVLAINAARAAAIAANAAAIANPLGTELNGAPLNQFALGGDDLEPLPPLAKTLSANIIADGNVIMSVSTVGEINRLPSGFLSRKWEIEIVGSQRVQQVAMATTVAELRAIAAS